MPTYSFQCKSCEAVVDVKNNIINRDDPLKEPCPKCGTVGEMVRLLDSPNITSGTPMNYGSRLPDGFKDVLRHMKKGSGKHCTIDV